MKAAIKTTVVAKPKAPKAKVEGAAEEVVEETAGEVTAEETVEEAAAEEVTETVAGASEEKVEEASAAEEPTPQAAAVPAHQKGWVQATCIRNVDPAPRIGHFNIGEELGVTKLSEGRTYKLPRHIVHHLVDAKIVVAVGN